MEPFVLTIWLWAGQRFEQIEIRNLDRAECLERLMLIGGDRGHPKDRGQCIGANGYIFPREIRTFPPCANAACGWDLPGRRRV
jgi:hypothetical protein